MKKIISMILVICLLTVSTVWTASAYDNNKVNFLKSALFEMGD